MFGIVLVVKFQCKEMSDLSNKKNYELKIRIKNYDLPKARVLDFYGFRKRKRKRKRKR